MERSRRHSEAIHVFHPSILNIKACPTPTTTLRSRVTDNLELTSNQLCGIVDRASFQKLQTCFIHNHLGRSRRVFGREDGVDIHFDGRRRFKRHEILEAVAAAGGYGDTEVVVLVIALAGDRWGGGGRYLLKPLCQ
jgi:hypothetical protein